MRIAVLYSGLSGYIAACLEAYREITSAELLIFAWPQEKNAPFADVSFLRLGKVFDRSKYGSEQIENALHSFRPDAILVSGWIDRGYIQVCRKFKGLGIPVIAACDTQWKGSLRQYLAAMTAPWYVHRFIDVLWVTGERQRQLAQALGFRGARCWDGFYACDWNRFARQTVERVSNRARSFLFVGRYVEEKGIQDLAAAYRIYRAKVDAPWSLICAGKGDLGSLLREVGAEDKGFAQPECLPGLMHQASAFVLPSRYEPWGVVLQEAAASQLPLIASDACGASVHLVRHGYNGFVTEPGNPDSLAWALLQMHSAKESELQDFGQRSFEFSKQYTPERWAKTLESGLGMWVESKQTLGNHKEDRI